MRPLPFVIAAALVLGPSLDAGAAEANSAEQVCQARAAELNITDAMRETYMRECLAGEQLNRKDAPSTK
jgi:hypothetical protein